MLAWHFACWQAPGAVKVKGQGTSEVRRKTGVHRIKRIGQCLPPEVPANGDYSVQILQRLNGYPQTPLCLVDLAWNAGGSSASAQHYEFFSDADRCGKAIATSAPS